MRNIDIQLIDRVNGEERLRDKEGKWAYKLKTAGPMGLNENDVFFTQNKRTRHTGNLGVHKNCARFFFNLAIGSFLFLNFYFVTFNFIFCV